MNAAEQLIAKARNLQAPSPTVVKLLNMLNDEKADQEEIVTAISRDAVLSAKLLALCNSASYGLAQPVASIEQGVLYLGYGEINRLVMALGFGGQIGAGLPGYDMEAGTLWRHSLTTALLTPRVTGRAKSFSADASIAYTAGLVHDIGKLVIGQAIEVSAREKIHQIVEAESAPLLQAEKTVIGCDHTEIGACLLRQWRIPEIIIEAVANHHHPPLGDGPRLSAAVHVADAVAHQTGASPGWGSFAVSLHEEVVTSLNLASADLDYLTFAALDCQDAIAQQETAASAKRPTTPKAEKANVSF